LSTNKKINATGKNATGNVLSRKSSTATTYRGPLGKREVYFLAILASDNTIERRVSPDYPDQWAGMSAWLRRRDPRAQLLRTLIFDEALT
jgi:hypothetical protein